MEFTDVQKAVLNHAITTWGGRQQINKAIEEMSELTQRLAKWQNREVKGPGFDAYGDPTPVIEEMADVYIMLEQLTEIFDAFGAKEKLPEMIQKKCQKLAGYLL